MSTHNGRCANSDAPCAALCDPDDAMDRTFDPYRRRELGNLCRVCDRSRYGGVPEMSHRNIASLSGNGETHVKDLSNQAFQRAASEAVKAALARSGTALLEPMMTLAIALLSVLAGLYNCVALAHPGHHWN